MIVMAKGLTSAYLPLGGVIVSDRVIDKFNDHPLVIGLTYSAHAASCAAALEAINIYENDRYEYNKVNDFKDGLDVPLK